MVGYRRNIVPGGTYFFTVTLLDRRSRVLVEHIGALREAFRRVRREKPFAIAAIVVLPDHLHAVLTLPGGDADYSGRWRRIKGLFTSRVAAANPRVRPDGRGEYRLWQRRYWEHTIRDDGDFARHLDYIHFNPVKHGLTSTACDWPYSSFHRFVRGGFIPADWGGETVATRGDFGDRP